MRFAHMEFTWISMLDLCIRTEHNTTVHIQDFKRNGRKIKFWPTGQSVNEPPQNKEEQEIKVFHSLFISAL